YRFICEHVDATTGALKEDCPDLPDEPASSATTIRWAPGAMDGVMGHHSAPEDDATTANKVAKALDRVARTGNARAVVDAYALLKEHPAQSLLDPVIELLVKWETPAQPHLSLFALQLAKESGDRNPVKVGIALIGAMRLVEQESIVTTLGLHD